MERWWRKHRRGWRAGCLLTLAWLVLSGLPARAQPRVALVVGVAAYQAVPPLANPANDAADVGAALTRLGFQTEVVIDPDRAVLEQAVRRFGARARGADAALFFYAGHAIEAAGRNWLLPRSVDITSDRDLRFEALDADGVLEQVEGAARVTLVLLDSCRDNPFRARLAGATRSAGAPGLAPVRAASGTLITFATAPGTVAEDGRGRNSPFTTALLKHVETPGLEIRQMMAEVRRDVRAATGGRQVPWEHSSLEGAFYFKPPAATTAPPTAPRAGAGDPEMLFWDSVRGSQDMADFRAYLERFPQGTFAPLARNRLAALGGTVAAPGAAPAPGPAPASGSGHAGALTEAALAAGLPHADPQLRLTLARGYLATALPRALAINPARRESWRASGVSPANAARIGEIALERCQVAFGSPCALIATNDRLEERTREGGWLPRDMPNVRYAGPYDPERIPGISAERRAQAGVRDYAAAPAPKAMAYHPAGGSLFWSQGATSQDAAAADALARCAADPMRTSRTGTCMLYALGNAVVLPDRRTVPGAAPAVVAQALPPAAVVPNAQAAVEAQLRAAMLRSLPTGATLSPARAESLASYAAAAGSKALALEPGGGLYRRTRRPSATEATLLALEGCALNYGRPCVLLAVDDDVSSPDPRTAMPREPPRLRQSGVFTPEGVPMTSANAMPSSVAGYAARPTPKALVLSASPPAFFVRGGATTAEAEAAALADCAAVPADGGGAPRCRVYALDNRVVLSEGRPRPAAAPARPAGRRGLEAEVSPPAPAAAAPTPGR